MLKKLDVFLLIIFPAAAVFLSLYFKTNFLASIFLFFGIPSLWFSLRTPKRVVKTLLFSILVSIPMVTVLDYVGGADMSWYVPTIFSFRILNTIPIEDFFMGFFSSYYTIIFYEHFLDKGKHNLVDTHFKYLAWPLIIILIIIVSHYLSSSTTFAIPYAYMWLGTILAVIPSLTFIHSFPKLISKYIKVTAYFFLLYLLFEITGLELKQWSFPGKNFIGWVELFSYRFPFEEFFFWMIMTTIAILSYYEFFDDDRK